MICTTVFLPSVCEFHILSAIKEQKTPKNTKKHKIVFFSLTSIYKSDKISFVL